MTSCAEGRAGKLKSLAHEAGFEIVGICDARPAETLGFYQRWLDAGYAGEMDYLRRSVELRQSLEAILPEAKSVLAVGLNYYQPLPRRPGYPLIARYALGRDYHRVIRTRLARLARQADAEIGSLRARACVDSAPMLEREYAQRAGLGWFGKNSCLIHSRKGSWFVLGFLLLDWELPVDAPDLGGCGTCQLCIDACPTGAIKELKGRWAVDARECISYLTIEHRGEFTEEQARKVGEWTVGCDVCQEVCPFNRARDHQPERAALTAEPDFLRQRTWPALEKLVQISEEAWDELTRGSATRRPGWEGLRRNARANLANRARTAD